MKKIINFLRKSFSLLKKILISLFLVFCVFFLVNNRATVLVNFKPLPLDIVETRVFVLMIGAYSLGIITAMILASANFLKFKIAKLRMK